MSGDRGCYAFHELIRAYAAELSDSTDTDTDRHEALARILDHYQHSSYAAQVELRPHREPTAPSPPPPGVTPEQFSDYASAISWFTAESNVLNASVSVAAGSDFAFPGLAAGPDDAAVLSVVAFRKVGCDDASELLLGPHRQRHPIQLIGTDVSG
jgi:hypothetical protein